MIDHSAFHEDDQFLPQIFQDNLGTHWMRFSPPAPNDDSLMKENERLIAESRKKSNND